MYNNNNNNNKPSIRNKVYLDGGENYIKTPIDHKIGQIIPVPQHYPKKEPFLKKQENGSIYEIFKPIFLIMRLSGIYPINIGRIPYNKIYKISVYWMIYSIIIFCFLMVYISYIKWDKVEIIRSTEGRFEEAVIDYLFTIYLLPIILNPIAFYEAKKQAKLITDWNNFEKIYKKVSNKNLTIFLDGNKPLIIIIILVVLSWGTMIITHATMVHFRLLQSIPYCYINMITYLIGGLWYLQCEIIGKTATNISEEFKIALKNIGPSNRIADYRSLWMILSKISQDMGNAFGHTLTFLCVYLFLIITLTIYGLLSQIQDGLGMKDIGLTITAISAMALLYFICDEAHYASNCIKVHFQKKLLLVELSWINDDAQQEINMFLRATEMNPTEINLGGFFHVNRGLFKSLLSTMVTYLVVLLQFQISIPDDNGTSNSNSNVNSTTIL